ncbi:MAG TPA: hypothetical protein PLZ86_00755 [bacterium]|nr:hypothetical protein [bacterium]
MNLGSAKAAILVAGAVMILVSTAAREAALPISKPRQEPVKVVQRGIRQEASIFALRNGWGALFKDRFDSASDFALIAAFMGEEEGAARLFASASRRRLRELEKLGSRIAEARAIGDARLALRLEALRDSLRLKGEVGISVPSGVEGELGKLIEEARLHIGGGREMQARASLVEALSLDPDDERVLGMMAEIDRSYDEEVFGAAVKEGEDIEKLLEEGIRLGATGRLEKSCGVLLRARIEAKRAPVSRQVEESAKQAHADCVAALKKKSMGSLSAYISDCESSASREAPEAIAKLREARSKTVRLLDVIGEDPELSVLKAKVEEAIAASSSRWLAQAVAAERFFGCSKALPIYRSIASVDSGASENAVSRAGDGIARCDKDFGKEVER